MLAFCKTWEQVKPYTKKLLHQDVNCPVHVKFLIVGTVKDYEDYETAQKF